MYCRRSARSVVDAPGVVDVVPVPRSLVVERQVGVEVDLELGIRQPSLRPGRCAGHRQERCCADQRRHCGDGAPLVGGMQVVLPCSGAVLRPAHSISHRTMVKGLLRDRARAVVVVTPVRRCSDQLALACHCKARATAAFNCVANWNRQSAFIPRSLPTSRGPSSVPPPEAAVDQSSTSPGTIFVGTPSRQMGERVEVSRRVFLVGVARQAPGGLRPSPAACSCSRRTARRCASACGSGGQRRGRASAAGRRPAVRARGTATSP